MPVDETMPVSSSVDPRQNKRELPPDAESRSPLSRRSTATLALILLLGAVLRWWGYDYGLPHPQARPDEDIVLEVSFQLLASDDYDPKFFDYPTLAIYLYTFALKAYYGAGALLGRYQETRDFLFDIVVLRPGLHYHIARALSLLLATGTIAATFWLGWRAYRRVAVGLVAALAFATCYLHVVFSRFATVDVAMTLFVTLAIASAIQAATTQRWRDYLLAGVFVGLSASAKYNAGIVALSTCAAAVQGLIRAHDWKGKRWVLGGLLTAGVTSLAVFLATSPYALVHYEAVRAALGKFSRILYDAPGEIGYWVHLKTTFPIGLGWPVFLFAMGGTLRALYRRRPADLAILAFLVPFFALVGGVRVVWPRYVLPLLPAMTVLAAELALSLFPRWPKHAAVATAALFAMPGLIRSVPFDQLASREDTRVLASQWVNENLPGRSKIVVCDGWGAPKINTDRRRAPAFEAIRVDCWRDTIEETGARYVVTNRYPPLPHFSYLRPEVQEWLDQRGRKLASFDPFRKPTTASPFYYPHDAFFLPLTNPGAVERGGPIVSIWEIRPE